MNKAHTTESKRSIKILILFCSIVGLLIIGSLAIKLFILMKESTFDSEHKYIVAFRYAKDVDIISLDPSSKSMNHMKVRGDVDPQAVFSQTGITPDGIFTLKHPFGGIEKVGAYINEAFLHKGGISSNLSSYDLFRLSFFAKGISSSEALFEEVSLPIESANLDILTRELFQDQAIADENKSVSVSNGAGVAGLGKRLERALENKGFSVIAVANADEVSSVTQVVYSGEKGYSVEKIEQILNVQASLSEEQGLSDIIITLGKDQAEALKF